jgi:glycosyltransferase involved in cell wall biosynthesis
VELTLDSQPIRVLLYSPLAGLDPLSGDATYSEALIKNPPAGVEYTTYAEALADGRLDRRGRKPRAGKTTRTDIAILSARVIEKTLRRRWMFPEATWFITVDFDSFDLIHNHIFTLRQVGRRLPMVSSAGYPLSELYRYRNRWGEGRASSADRLETTFARALNSHRAGYWAPEPDLLTVYTQYYREWLINRGVPANRVGVLGQGLADAPVAKPVDEPILGFIGRDFARKGGLRAVAAFEYIRRRIPGARLVIVSDEASIPRELRADPRLEIVTDASRDDVLKVHLPRMSVLLAPTNSDCGVPYAVIESLRAGVPVILSSSPWLDGRLVGPGAHRASDPEEVASVAQQLLEDSERAQVARQHAREQYEELLSLERWHADLRATYGLALSLARQPSGAPA